ncbi:unnamed protein product [Lepidochelys kempii]
MQQICKALNISQHVYCAPHPQSAGAVERKNGELKNKISKICAETNLKWPDALPLALMCLRSTPECKHGLSPYEILMARPMCMPASPPRLPCQLDLQLNDDTVMTYCQMLICCIRSIHSQVQSALVEPADILCYPLQPGDWVYIKVYQRKTSLEPHRKGPNQILLTTIQRSSARDSSAGSMPPTAGKQHHP